MTANNRRPEPGRLARRESWLLVGLLCVALATVGLVWVSVQAGNALAGLDPVRDDPFVLLIHLAQGKVAWTSWSTAVAAAIAVVLTVAAAVAVRARPQRRRGRSRVDRAASYMGRGRDIDDLTLRTAQEKARRLGVAATPGVPIGRSVATGERLWGSWEDMHIDIWGPRTGKTTSRAVPAILGAPGAVLVTSNKRDVADATRDVRAKSGPVWVFDPQRIALEEPGWWWNPLSYVTDEVKAQHLAEHFVAASARPGARSSDPHFEDSGRDLLAGMLLAAALDGRPITAAYTWLTKPTNEEPADIVRDHGIHLTADQMVGFASLPDRERGSVYSTARRYASCLTNRQIARWVTPHGDGPDPRPQFRPDDFVLSGGTLYSLSKEGQGTAGPLVTALTVAVVEAAEELASRSAGGRLATPLLGVLDEAANVCRWAELPNLYSHYGSRGIVLMTILQGWSQGVEVWGEHGMRKLWSAANIRVYGGGVNDDGFLETLSKVIGDYDRMTSSTSSGRGHRSVSAQLHRERILDVSELASLPKGRAVVLASGSRPTLVRTEPWMSGPQAAEVAASIAAHDPHAEHTIREAQTELVAVETAAGSEEAVLGNPHEGRAS
ncbi:type IV secretory system conjugative DNA transfer family protein [Propionicicella superfundia]|uniref:type IV secretory system conjugative DNA transfer family protein n=1 Tax=Propionicicella superfundia TaxID=348582 RepID=UPI000407A485|nr:TraM recognition domain-containing protein [Propionicicella superfundia]